MNRDLPCRNSSTNNTGGGGGNSKILAIPFKSPNDDKEYRVIELANGVKVVLISYNPCVKFEPKVDRDRNCLNKAISRFNSEVVGVEVHDSVQKERPKPIAKSRTKRKGSKLPVVHSATPVKDCDLNENFIGIAVNVGTGFYHEPKEIPGISHLVEHVILIGGSEKYPDSQFMKLLSDNQAHYFNASTRGAEVYYYMGIRLKKVPKIVDHFANLFVAPTLYLKDIQVEREAVDSEFLDSRLNDVFRTFRMYQMFMKSDHPAAVFQSGSRETLVAPDGKDATLREILLAYVESDYRADNINVGIQGPLPLDDIQNLAEEYFGQIPKRKTLDRKHIPDSSMASDPAKFRRFYSVKSGMDLNMLWVAWDLPLAAVKNYHTKPLKYLGSLIESDSPGGLANYLKERYWISSMLCLVPGAGDHEYSSVMFRITFYLERIEMEIIIKILEALHSYLKFLLNLGPQEWHFNEQRWTESLKFHFGDENNDPISNAARLAANLRHYKPEDCVIGDSLLTKWDHNAILACLQELTPCKANVMFVSSSVKNCNYEENFFKIKYKVMKDSKYMPYVRKWSTIEPFPEFQFQGSNEFITTCFCRSEQSKDVDECLSQIEKEVCLLQDSRVKICNTKTNSVFRNYSIHIDTAISFNTSQNRRMRNIWLRLLDNQLRPLLFDAREAMFDYKMTDTTTGMLVEINGFSQHFHRVLLKIVHQIENSVTSITKEMYEGDKGRLLQGIIRSLKNPDWLQTLLFISMWFQHITLLVPQVYNAVANTSFQDFQTFLADFKEQIFISVDAQGDVDKESSLKFAKAITDIINYDVLPPCSNMGHTPPIEMPASQFPLGHTILRVRNKNPTSNKASFKTLYQVYLASWLDKWILEYLAKIMHFPAYMTLRRKYDLGYVAGVYSEIGPFQKSACLIVFVYSHSDKFSGTYVADRVEEFVEEFYEDVLTKMNPKDFSEEFSQEKLKPTWKQVLRYFETYLLPGPSSEMRKLTTQVVGKDDQEYSREIIQDLMATGRGNRELKKINPDLAITVLVPNEVEEERFNRPNQRYIENIMDFKSELFTYPAV